MCVEEQKRERTQVDPSIYFPMELCVGVPVCACVFVRVCVCVCVRERARDHVCA